MKNIQPKQNNFQNNRKFTELPITIVTDEEYKAGDNLELIRQRIEKATLYIHSLFNMVRYSLENLPSFDDRKVEETVWDARSVCEIGYGVADSILASVSGLTEFQPDNAVEAEKQAVEEFGDERPFTSDLAIDNLALAISGLLNNEKVPRPIRRGIGNVMADFFNEHVDQSKFEDIDSSEYIAQMLKCYKKVDES